tara:strand:+ start:9597 stop:10019 length:423 start_codon:yes stop_codon:yes gene_type:complete
MRKGKSSQIQKLTNQIETMNKRINKTQETANELIKGLKEMRQKKSYYETQLGEMKDTGELTVSDHSLMRYAERVKGVELEKYRQELIDIVKYDESYKKLDCDCKLPIVMNGEPFRVIIKNNNIISIVNIRSEKDGEKNNS